MDRAAAVSVLETACAGDQRRASYADHKLTQWSGCFAGPTDPSIIGYNDLVIISNNDVITDVILSNNGEIITVIIGNNVVITDHGCNNECNNDGLISNNDDNNEGKQVIMM